MTESSKAAGDEAVEPGRRIRADARRNEDAVLEAAKQVFAASGVDAPVREIAARAGVGVGTLYRRFPNRSDLVAAVFRREVDACAAEAAALAAAHSPGEALGLWLRRYTRFIATKKGLAAALHSGDQVFETLPAYFRTNFEPALTALLEAAAAAGEIRGGVAAYDLLRAVGNLSVASGEEGDQHTQRMLDLLIDGLRYGAAARQEPTVR
ncbi:helix-turn-helix domain-containing protein [Hoeflea sp.]|uniref:TetR/AcrR family transcriptional regulator n=1 Tax=Hoeflea sp. TaxID=1940281 RepID=UPI0025C07079|nr:helix-turn-helix domain-containing protein [Hoeflea sp.]MBU4530470.1 TetR/AcrR family transcriptional regulator [Alphaproteobacteria bacterium]MBU4545257.1 TetR/AcrR family transcriptional regulator [Alphaproteobacteria bacterium]MBU4548906.1 TetR/AcrR family transcriptional regulator [Alphaproteobacteria bacterium]